jgi:hypothetical protein
VRAARLCRDRLGGRLGATRGACVGIIAAGHGVLRELVRLITHRGGICLLRVREAWGLGRGPISSMVALLEPHGVLPVEIEGHSERLDAFSAWARRRPMVFLATEKGSASRRASTPPTSWGTSSCTWTSPPAGVALGSLEWRWSVRALDADSGAA